MRKSFRSVTRPNKRSSGLLQQIVFSFIYACLLLGVSGFTDLAWSLSCSDVISGQTTYRYNEALYGFKYFNGKTYAIALSALTGKTSGPDGFSLFHLDSPTGT